jgi:GAF domain-containing protein/PAS domain-containing protein/CheY-like chemotaxis protein
VLFSEALLDLVPDGVAVVDERLCVRAANAAFARAFGQPGMALRDKPLFRRPVPGRGGRSLADVLRDVLETGVGLTAHDLEAPGDWGSGDRWTVRAAAWDTEDPAFRRILLCVEATGGPLQPGAPVAPPAASVPAEPPRPAEPLSEPERDRLFAAVALNERLLEALPVGACILDGALRVRAANRRVQELFGRGFRPDQPGDRHLFAIFPVTRDAEFRERLERCRDSADSVRGILSVTWADGSPVELEVEVQPIAGPGHAVGDLLLLFHEVRGMSPPNAALRTGSDAHVPAGLADVVSKENLQRWTAPESRRVLVVERDAWSRMLLADTLRQAGFDATLVESGRDALAAQDVGSFGLVAAGLDADPDDAAELCRRVTEEHPGVPVLAVTRGSAASAAEAVGSLPLFGILPDPASADLRAVLDALYRTEAGATGTPEAQPDVMRTYDVVVIGAAEPDVAVLRLLYRVDAIRVRMVYDPDPNAFGLSLAQNLGIPSLSGELSMHLGNRPDAVVVARDDLEKHLDALDLGDVPRVTRDELEIFLVDPESFLAADRPDAQPAETAASAGSAPEPAEEPPTGPAGGESDADPPRATDEEPATADEPPAGDPPAAAEEPGEPSAAPDEPPAPDGPRFRGSDEPPSLGAQALERPPERTVPETEEPHAAPADESFAGEVDSLLGALDLLLDFDRFAQRVLDMAIGLAGGQSGSLMVLREDRPELRIVASQGLSDLVVQQTRQPVGEGVSGRVAESGEPLLLTGAIRDEHFERPWVRPDVRSSICAPVCAETRVVGVLCVNSDPKGEPFGRDELRRVSELGRQMGAALDRSLLLRRMRGRSFELAVRGEIETIASSQDDPVSRLRKIAVRMVEMLSIDSCAIYVLDSKRGELLLRAVAGVTPQTMDALSVPLGTGLVGWVGRSLQSVALKSVVDLDTQEDPGVAAAAVPIRYRTDLIGVMAFEATSGIQFDDERLQMLGTVAGVIGRELGGLRAHEDSERKVTMLSALSELGLAMSAVPEREGLARLATFSACTVLESDVSSVRVLAAGRPPSSPELADFELLGVHGASPTGPGDPLTELEKCVAQEVQTSRVPRRDVDLDPARATALLARANVSSVLGVPVTTDRGELLGILVVYRAVDEHAGSPAFRDEEVEVASRLADYVAASVQRFLTAEAGPGGETDHDA